MSEARPGAERLLADTVESGAPRRDSLQPEGGFSPMAGAPGRMFKWEFRRMAGRVLPRSGLLGGEPQGAARHA